MENSTIAIKEDSFKLESAAKEVGLRINEIKTNYMATIRTERRDRIEQNVTMDQYNFETVSTSIQIFGCYDNVEQQHDR